MGATPDHPPRLDHHPRAEAHPRPAHPASAERSRDGRGLGGADATPTRWDGELWIEDGAARLAEKAVLDSLTPEDWAEIYAGYDDAAEDEDVAAPGGEAAQAAETGTGSTEGEHPVAEGQVPEDLSALKAENERLKAERDEADRRAGAAEREMSSLKEDARKERWWLEDAKRARGYDIGVSFDTVWAETCAKADKADQLTAALAESERKRVEAVEALKPFALAAEHYEPDEGDGDHSLWADDGLRVRHLRAASSALITQETTHAEG